MNGTPFEIFQGDSVSGEQVFGFDSAGGDGMKTSFEEADG